MLYSIYLMCGVGTFLSIYEKKDSPLGIVVIILIGLTWPVLLMHLVLEKLDING